MRSQSYSGIKQYFLRPDKTITLHKKCISKNQYMLELKRCYEVLNVKESSDQETIRKAYIDLARRFHPDSGSPEADSDKFKEIVTAFNFLNRKNAQDRWGVDDNKRVEEFDIKHTAPQHRQYLNFDGVGFGTPSQRQKQWTKKRAMDAANNVMEHRISKALAGEGALLDKKDIEQKHKIKTQTGFDRLVEDLIQEAISKGEFSNLPGSGKPLSTNQNINPYVDFVTYKVNQVLIDSGFTPQWISLQKEIRHDVETLRLSLFTDRSLLGPLPLTPQDEHTWELYLGKHKSMADKINTKISNYNLVVPILQKQMYPISVEKEAEKVLLEGKDNTQIVKTITTPYQNVDSNQQSSFLSIFFSIFK